jgi:BASS family bile acid:Na+ symporter
MPFLAWLLCRLFSLPTELAIGVILVGCCPGGTASNVITYLAKGDVPLSVGMTTVSTILAPLLTPFLTYLVAGKSIDVDVMGMFISILQVVILPIVAGLIIDYYFGKFTKRIMAFLPMVSTITIAIIIACVISHNAQKILECTLLIWGVVILHNLLGFGLGYTVGKLLKLPKPKRNAIAIEVGMQNSGLATSLATTHFALYPMAAIPGAIFSVWHNFSGSIAASIFRRGV